MPLKISTYHRSLSMPLKISTYHRSLSMPLKISKYHWFSENIKIPLAFWKYQHTTGFLKILTYHRFSENINIPQVFWKYQNTTGFLKISTYHRFFDVLKRFWKRPAVWNGFMCRVLSHPAFTCSKATIETPE